MPVIFEAEHGCWVMPRQAQFDNDTALLGAGGLSLFSSILAAYQFFEGFLAHVESAGNDAVLFM